MEDQDEADNVENPRSPWPSIVASLLPPTMLAVIGIVSFLSGQVWTLWGDVAGLQSDVKHDEQHLKDISEELKAVAIGANKLSEAMAALTISVQVMSRQFDGFEREITATPLEQPRHR